jgi:hypothetical protein
MGSDGSAYLNHLRRSHHVHTPEPRPAPHASDDACGKPGLNAFGRRFMEIFCAAIDSATQSGVDRAAIAAAIGVSPHTVESWLKPSRTSTIPVDRLFELAAREDILPGAVRDALWADLGCEGGYVVVPEIHIGAEDEGGVTPIVHLAQIAVALGKLAEQIRAATTEEGPGGRAISETEARAMLTPLRDMEREAVELRLSLEDLINRARHGAASPAAPPRQG